MVVEIIVIVTLVLGFAVFITFLISNNKKIKNDKLKQDEANKKADADKKSEKDKVAKKIVQENSVNVENYIKETLLKDELNIKKTKVNFEEVSESVMFEDNNLQEEGAIVLGKKKQEVHEIEDDDDEEYRQLNSTFGLTYELDNAEASEIVNSNKTFEVDTFCEKDNDVIDEIKSLSKESKIVLVSNLLDKKDK